MSDFRGLGMSLDQTHHAVPQPNSRNMLVLVSVGLFAVAGTAGTFLAFGQRGAVDPAAQPVVMTSDTGGVATSAPAVADFASSIGPAPVVADFASAIAPAPAPTPVAAPAPVVEPVAVAAPAPTPVAAPAPVPVSAPAPAAEPPMTVAEYIATLEELGVDMPSARARGGILEPEVAAPAVVAEPPAPQQVAFNDLTPDTGILADANCISTLDAQAASLLVPFGPSAVATPDEALRGVFDLARRVINCEGAYIVVAGHADPSGNETQNLVLSWQRAEFVVDTLVSAGFEANRVEAIGFGSRRPISEGDAGGDDVLNRRVDFVVRAAQP